MDGLISRVPTYLPRSEQTSKSAATSTGITRPPPHGNGTRESRDEPPHQPIQMIQSGWDRVPYRQRKETDPRRQFPVAVGATNRDGWREGGGAEDGDETGSEGKRFGEETTGRGREEEWRRGGVEEGKREMVRQTTNRGHATLQAVPVPCTCRYGCCCKKIMYTALL
jgi:hypothetical protein